MKKSIKIIMLILTSTLAISMTACKNSEETLSKPTDSIETNSSNSTSNIDESKSSSEPISYPKDDISIDLSNLIANGECGKNNNDNISWSLDNNGTLLISGSGEMEDCISLNKLAWYSYKDKIKKVKIEYGVTSIGTGAFSDCKNLCSISIPDSITKINGLAFCNCTELVNINLPDGISKIQTSTFKTCSKLKSINIPDSVTNIEESAFADCLSLKNINISDNVENIENGAFYNCKSLKEINVNPNNKDYLSENGILFDINKTNIICCPAGKTGNYTIPDSVKDIEDYSFYGCNLSNIEIPKTVSNIKSYAFACCEKLKDIKISDNINSIGEFAFFKCNLLKSITIPSKNVKIYDDTFFGCDSLEEINISPDNKYYTSSDGVLFNKNKTELICCPMGKTGDYIIPNSVKIIKSPGFNCCKKLTSITIPNNIDQINNYAFGFLIDTQTIYIQGKSEPSEKWENFWDFRSEAKVIWNA